MKVSERLEQGQSLPRGSWRGVDPRTKVVPAKKGQKSPYSRQSRRKSDGAEERWG
ncbi:MAG: hypothetical protein M1272_07800 [Firmicutes bacterium]|nr:hypothetical protein [Bacillota bacterium]